jgi:hypothetical protein
MKYFISPVLIIEEFPFDLIQLGKAKPNSSENPKMQRFLDELRSTN